MDLSIIIVNYNLSTEIKECIVSINKKLTGLDYEIIVVDNNSKDIKSKELQKEFLSEIYKNISFFYLDENIGFGQGCNYGANKAKGKIFCFLNPDTIISDNIFPAIINMMKNDNSIGITGPGLNNNNKHFDYSAGLFPNIILELLNVFFLGRYAEAHYLKSLTEKNKNSPINVEWVMGAALFIKKEVFELVGGFDKAYFLFFEELDLCYKVLKSGFKIVYFPFLSLQHLGSVTVKKDYAFFTRLFYKSKLIFIKKNYSGFYKFLIELLVLLQIYSQLILWSVIYPLNKDKSRGKIKGLLAVNALFFKNTTSHISDLPQK